MNSKINNKRWMIEQFETGLISVIMPTYNRADLIVKALDSVWWQTYRPIELIIVDDGSNDDTARVVHDWKGTHEGKSDFQVRCFYQDNAGPSSARNYGLIESHGEFLQFLDSDDLIPEERLSKVIDVFLSSDCEFVETGFNGFCSKCGQVYEEHYGHTITDPITLLLIGRLWGNTLRSSFRRNLVVRTGPWNEEMSCFEDYEYVARALLISRKNEAIRDILASARRGGDQRISDRLKTYEGRAFRIHCEKVICDGIRARKNIPLTAKHDFASRLYTLGIRCNARGWENLGRQCLEIADLLGIQLDNRCKLKRLICWMGKPGGLLYKLLFSCLKYFFNGEKSDSLQHHCNQDNGLSPFGRYQI